jgi:hypothetical protein
MYVNRLEFVKDETEALVRERRNGVAQRVPNRERFAR